MTTPMNKDEALAVCKRALKAVDSLDDYARMNIGVNAHGPRNAAIDSINALRAHLSALHERVERLDVEAARYRWLRDTQAEEFGDEYGFTFVYVRRFYDFQFPKRGLDAAIDTARAQQGGGEAP